MDAAGHASRRGGEEAASGGHDAERREVVVGDDRNGAAADQVAGLEVGADRLPRGHVTQTAQPRRAPPHRGEGTRSPMVTTWSAAGTPRIPCRKIVLMMLNTAVFSPMPQPSDSTAISDEARLPHPAAQRVARVGGEVGEKSAGARSRG